MQDMQIEIHSKNKFEKPHDIHSWGLKVIWMQWLQSKIHSKRTLHFNEGNAPNLAAKKSAEYIFVTICYEWHINLYSCSTNGTKGIIGLRRQSLHKIFPDGRDTNITKCIPLSTSSEFLVQYLSLIYLLFFSLIPDILARDSA